MGSNENGVYVKKNDRGMYNCMYLIMELCSNGELFDILFNTGRFDEFTARFYFRQLIEGLAACHSAGISHRDMKPENVLFDDAFNLKISDFGFSIFSEGHDGSGRLKTHLGTEGYMAPEIHMRRPYSGESVDLFACGIILFIMYSQNPPFGKADPNDPYYRLLSNGDPRFWQLHSRNKPPNFYTEEFKDLIQKMLALDPTARLSIEDIKQHPWYNGAMVGNATIIQEIKGRRDRIVQAAQRAKEQRNRMGPGRGVGIAGGRAYRGDLSESEGLSLSFSVNNDDFVAQPPVAVEGYKQKYTQILTGLLPQEVMTLVSYVLAQADAEVETDQENFQITANVITEEDEVSFELRLFQAPEEMYLLDAKLTQGNQFEMMRLFGDINERIQEAQSSDL